MYTVMKDIFADKNRQEAIFLSGEGKDLEYTIVRPGGLGIGAPTGIINVIEGNNNNLDKNNRKNNNNRIKDKQDPLCVATWLLFASER